MEDTDSIKKVDIRPGVNMLAVLRHLNYRPWFALGEFVDNSIQSYLSNRDKLRAVHGNDSKLSVTIDIESSTPAKIVIRDNAAGIAKEDYARAFKTAAVPPDRRGLAEFGMGMKSAACWFAPEWSVRTSALGESVSRKILFDISNIISDSIEELNIQEREENSNHHFTELTLENVFQPPVGRTVHKIKEHLTDIYREFIRNGILELRLNNELLTYQDPVILKAPYFKNKSGPVREWRKDIEFDFGDGLKVRGFAALRATASTKHAGFSLFRRGRVIQGSGDEGYRPTLIFGNSNSFRYQRVFGELHLDGFEVSHTKDGIRWDENEIPFLELLYEHLDDNELPLLRQAEGFRARAAQDQLIKAAQRAVVNVSEAMEAHLPGVLPAIIDAPPVDTPNTLPPSAKTLATRNFKFIFRDRTWEINIELSDEPGISDWLDVRDFSPSHTEPRLINIRLSMIHPFMERFAQSNTEDVEAILRIAAAISVAEVTARNSGVSKAGTIRRAINEILLEVLSEP